MVLKQTPAERSTYLKSQNKQFCQQVIGLHIFDITSDTILPTIHLTVCTILQHFTVLSLLRTGYSRNVAAVQELHVLYANIQK